MSRLSVWVGGGASTKLAIDGDGMPDGILRCSEGWRKRRGVWMVVGLWWIAWGLVGVGSIGVGSLGYAQEVVPFPGTEPLLIEEDLASVMVSGIDRFLLRQIEERREARWREVVDAGVVERWRRELSESLGVRWLVDGDWKRLEEPIAEGVIRVVRRGDAKGPLGRGPGWTAEWVEWEAYEGVRSCGMLLVPDEVRFLMIGYPDAGQMPWEVCGVTSESSRIALECVAEGGLVLIPAVIQRDVEKRLGRARLTDQEYLYRSAFVLGRHVAGFQVQEGVAALAGLRMRYPGIPMLTMGWGEGGWLASLLAAMDSRIDGAVIAGHFGPRENVWREPIHRNIQGLLHFGTDVHTGMMLLSRGGKLVVEGTPGPAVDLAGEGGAPGSLRGPEWKDVQSEFEVLLRVAEAGSVPKDRLELRGPADGGAAGVDVSSLRRLLEMVGIAWKGKRVEVGGDWDRAAMPVREEIRNSVLRRWDRFQQALLGRVDQERNWLMKIPSESLSSYEAAMEKPREEFAAEVIGRWELPKGELKPRSRRIYDRPTWEGYEVVLEVFADVIAEGVLLVPKDREPGHRYPCVVFQHGLEGRPQDTIEGNHEAYHDVAARLVERGYIVFAPQNPYLFTDRFRSLQRKSNPLGKTLFSTIIAQHEQVVSWLQTLPEVDPERIGFYGLSYGGKSAMRIPAVVKGYCLSICSADFNDWVWKNASTESPYSYVWTGEYEIFEFGLGPRFNYAEMAALIAPRPFMVERGHFDGVAPDERVALEYAKVRYLYAARLGIPDRTEIEFFKGPHTIHGERSFQFLDRFLKGASHR